MSLELLYHKKIIDALIFKCNLKDVDLRNKVKMKPRKSYKDKSSKEKGIHKKEIISTRNYEAYLEFLTNNRTAFIHQLDLVQRTKEIMNHI